jgi:YspA, cpYpsA-related SLOG family
MTPLLNPYQNFVVGVFTGSRKWTDAQAVMRVFDEALQQNPYGFFWVVTGDQKGLDRLAYQAALAKGYRGRVTPVHAWWNEDGRGAGNIRNGQMVNVALELARSVAQTWAAHNDSLRNIPHPSQFVRGFAFPDKDSVGTWNCVDDMIRADIQYENRGTSPRRGR